MTSKYDKALNRVATTEDNQDITVLDWVIQQIKTSKNGIIKLKVSDLRKALGPEFVKMKDSAFYTGLRYIMRKYNILMKCETKEDGTLITMMSFLYAEEDFVKK